MIKKILSISVVNIVNVIPIRKGHDPSILCAVWLVYLVFFWSLPLFRNAADGVSAMWQQYIQYTRPVHPYAPVPVLVKMIR